MKNLYKITMTGFNFLLLLLCSTVLFAQTPLLPGDAVITVNEIEANSPVQVLKTIHTNNTSGAPLGENWNTSFMTPPPGGGNKPANNSRPNWVRDILGNIFGITLDDSNPPNIYVSQTQIYSGSIIDNSASIVWMLDGNLGANTEVFDFDNEFRSLGNLKYRRIGPTENIYVSNFENGFIERLTGGASLWAQQTAFNPRFGEDPDGEFDIPYGLAVRRLPNGTFRLYYARASIIAPHSRDEIWAVDLGPAGGFLPLTETLQITPTYFLNGVSTSVFLINLGIFGNTANSPIADIAFTSDGENMLLGQQTWFGFANLAPHRARVLEFSLVNGTQNEWEDSGNDYPAGIEHLENNGANAVGGVSYSNHILQTVDSLQCDTTVWFMADTIENAGINVYGIQGMPRGLGNSRATSIWIDEDDRFIDWRFDKRFLGDVEVYKQDLICEEPCECGDWGEVQHNGTILVENPTKKISYNLQLNKNAITGLLHFDYSCLGDCDEPKHEIIVERDGKVIASIVRQTIDLAEIDFDCGNYVIRLRPVCDTEVCDERIVNLTIVCQPVDCCESIIAVEPTNFTVEPSLSPDLYSTLKGQVVISTSSPMSEVRVSVEDFQVTADSEACLLCNNKPVTWGNIEYAKLNGRPMEQTALTNPSPNMSIDYREVTLATGAPIILSNALLNIKLDLPSITDLSCCDVKVEFCLKITFIDLECRECVKYVCGETILSNPEECDDTDKDGVCDDVDNCVYTYNPTQADADNDGIGDACDGVIQLPIDISTVEFNTWLETLEVEGIPLSKLVKQTGNRYTIENKYKKSFWAEYRKIKGRLSKRTKK